MKPRRRIPTAKDVKRLLTWVLPRLPQAPESGKRFASRYPALVREIAQDLRSECRLEKDSYGQGYASFVEAWFYRDEQEFKTPTHSRNEVAFNGVMALLSRMGPYYALVETNKSWRRDGRSGSGTLPGFENIDSFPTPAIEQLSLLVDRSLNGAGLIRLRRADMSAELPTEFCFESNLAGDKHRIFDALFYWYD